MSSSPPKKKYVPHKVLREGTVFASVADSDYVIAFRPVIAKVSRVQDEKGNPAFNADGTPAYWVEWSQVITMLTNDEWRTHKQQGE